MIKYKKYGIIFCITLMCCFVLGSALIARNYALPPPTGLLVYSVSSVNSKTPDFSISLFAYITKEDNALERRLKMQEKPISQSLFPIIRGK